MSDNGVGILDFFLEKWIIVFLVFARISGLFLLFPLFRMQVVPFMLKIFLGIIFSFAIALTLNLNPNLDINLWSLTFLIGREIIIGLLIGFIFNLVFWGMRLGGGVIDFELGFQAAMLFTFQETSPTLFGQLLEMITLMLFLFLNGHHQVFEALYLSYAKIPIGSGTLTPSTIAELGKFLTNVTIIGLKVSAPIFVSTFLVNISLAMLARMAPQTNIFVISFQVKIAIALLVFFLAVSFFILAAKQFLQLFQSQVNLILTLT